MTVEVLNHMMTYVIEGWVLLSTAYLGVGFALSLSSKVRRGLKQRAAAQADAVASAERVAEVKAVAAKYGKAKSKAAPQEVTVPDAPQ